MEKSKFVSEISEEKKINTAIIIESKFSKEIQIILPQGETMKEHKTRFPIQVHVISGEIDFTATENTTRLSQGNIIALKANIAHNLIAIKDTIVRLTLSKSDNFKRVQNLEN